MRAIHKPLALGVAACLLFGACSSAANSSTAPASAAASSAPASSAPASSAPSAGASSAPAAGASGVPSGAAITVGELMPMTGKEGFVGEWFTHGANAGVYDVNQNGGVLGHQLKIQLEDTAGDPVDAVTAFRTLMTYNPTFIVGPSSLEIQGVMNLFQPSNVPDFMEGGTTILDKMQNPYVFRVFPSDSVLLAAEAYYAIKDKGCTQAALMYQDSANSQGEVPPLVAAFTGNGGKILANIKLEPGKSSYLSEVATAFAGKPQCVFFHADPQMASTLFANVKELGHLNVPFIAGDTGASIQLADAMGLQDASKYMTGMNGAVPSGPAYSEFLNAYQAVWHTNKPLPASPAMYDAVILASLAMTDAKSTNPSVWLSKVTDVSNPPGTACYTYASCVQDLQAGQKINYSGASGNEDFNQYHNVFTPFDVVQFDTSGNLHNIYHVSSADIASFYGGSGS